MCVADRRVPRMLAHRLTHRRDALECVWFASGKSVISGDPNLVGVQTSKSMEILSEMHENYLSEVVAMLAETLPNG